MSESQDPVEPMTDDQMIGELQAYNAQLLAELADLRQVAQGLREEVEFLTEVRSNQAHLIKCLQSEVANLRGGSNETVQA